jgi:hypothetical protein
MVTNKIFSYFDWSFVYEKDEDRHIELMDNDVVAISLILLKAIHVESVETRGGIGDPFQIQLLHSENICPDRSTRTKQRGRNNEISMLRDRPRSTLYFLMSHGNDDWRRLSSCQLWFTCYKKLWIWMAVDPVWSPGQSRFSHFRHESVSSY